MTRIRLSRSKVKGQGHQAALLTAALTRQAAAAVSVGTYWEWETTATNKCKLNCDEFKKYLSSSHMNSMFCDLVDSTELSIIIHKMKPNKSPGPDNIGPKEVAEILTDPLVHIFNLSLTTGVVPDKLKIAKIIPVFKKGDPQLPSNYRPISLLNVFSKLLEKIMYKRLYSYLNSNNKLYQYQFGAQFLG